jgi:hypothetical protein
MGTQGTFKDARPANVPQMAIAGGRFAPESNRDAPAAGVASASRWEEKTDGRRPWLVEETETTFIVRTANRLVVSLIYFDNEPRRRSFNLTKDEARRVARSIARLPDLLSPRE